MSVVSLLGVNVLNNPAKFGDSYEFEITFECLESLQKGTCYFLSTKLYFLTFFLDLEWKLTYVGSATSYVPLPFPPLSSTNHRSVGMSTTKNLIASSSVPFL
jgi:hypothetical protein